MKQFIDGENLVQVLIANNANLRGQMETINSHISNKNNPHSVTAEQLGLDSVVYFDEDSAETTSAISLNADTLGMNPPEYYATSDALSAVLADVKNNTSMINQVSNPNIIINPNFKINQRGLNVYTTDGINWWMYTVDRWCISNTEYCIGNTLSINDTGTITYLIKSIGSSLLYYVENFKDYIGKTLTLSCKTSSVTGDFIVCLATSGDVLSEEIHLASDSIASVTWTIPENPLYLAVSIVNKSVVNTQASIELEWVKLEIGDKATPYIPPNPAEEMTKCMRYFQTIMNVCDNCRDMITDRVFYQMKFLPMRIVPSGYFRNENFNSSGAFVASMNGEIQSGFTFSVYPVSNSCTDIYAYKENHGLNRIEGAKIECLNNPICLDAEIYY